MSFEVYCPTCRKKYAADARTVGKRIRCRQCSTVFLVDDKDSSSSSTMGRSSSSVLTGPTADRQSNGTATAPPPPRPARTAPAVATVAKSEWRESVPQPFAMSEVLESWVPLAMGLIALIWIPAQTFGDNRSGVMWAPVVRIASFLAIYFLLVIPLTVAAIKSSFGPLRRVLPLNMWMRAATTFALPAIFAFSFSLLTGMFGFVLGCILGLAVASAVYWLMFRLDLEEMAIPYAVAAGTFFGSALLGAFMLMGVAALVNHEMVSAKATDGIHENPVGPQFAWVVPSPPDSAVVRNANEDAPASSPPSQNAAPLAPANTPTPDQQPFPTTDSSGVAAPGTPVPPASGPQDVPTSPAMSPKRPAPLFEVEPGPADSDPFVVSVVSAHLPWVKTVYRPADQGIYDEAISPLTPSPFVGLVRIPGIGGRTIECCRLAPVYRGLGSLPLADENSDASGSSGLRALSPDGSVLLRLVNDQTPQVSVLPFAGLGSKVTLVMPDGLANPASGGPPPVPEILGALPGSRFLLRWNTPEHSVLQVYSFGKTEAQTPFTVRLGHSDTPGVFSVSPDGNSFAVAEREADKPFLAVYKLVGLPASPVMLPIDSLNDTADWDVTGIAFSHDGTKVGVLIEKGSRGTVRSWAVDGGPRLAEGSCTVPSANEMLGQVRGRPFDWLTNNAWLVHGRTVLDANSGLPIGALTSELVTGQQLADDRTFYLSYLGTDGHPHTAVVRFDPSLLDAAAQQPAPSAK